MRLERRHSLKIAVWKHRGTSLRKLDLSFGNRWISERFTLSPRSDHGLVYEMLGERETTEIITSGTAVYNPIRNGPHERFHILHVRGPQGASPHGVGNAPKAPRY